MQFFDQDHAHAYRRNLGRWGIKYEKAKQDARPTDTVLFQTSEPN